jgi:transcriptional regulator with XRE-family HTH domain
MQHPEHYDEPSSTFAERAKAARLRAGLSQQQLVELLAADADVALDTSAITRIESGKREPRLGEALAIARVLDFGLNNLVPRADLDYYMRELEQSMNQSRAALVEMFRSLNSVVKIAQESPAQLGDASLEDRISEIIEWFDARVSHDGIDQDDQQARTFAIATTRADERLKRQLLRAVTDGVLVRADEVQPATERWYKDELVAERSERRPASAAEPRAGRPHDESLVRAQRWDRRFEQLLEYVREHGDAQVPRSYITRDGERLGSWVAVQRDHFARELLDPERATQLERLPGWVWDPRARRAKARGTSAPSGDSRPQRG